MSGTCKVCGGPIRLRGTTIKDGSICVTCRGSLPLNVYSRKEEYTGDRIRQLFEELGVWKEKPSKGLFGRKDDRTEELREYKRMLDEGLITQEDYDRKKAEVLDKK